MAALLAAYVLVVANTLGQPLLERHRFRQTQTAYTARVFHEQGIDLLHPKLPVFGEPFEVPFEFPLFQAAASVVMDTGVGEDLAMRLTGLACFLLTALLLYGLVRHVAGRPSAIAALVAFVFTPLSLLWGRTSMIEYLATAGAIGFAWAAIVWRERQQPAVGGLALAAGLVGMLVKPTTAVFWLLPPLLYRPRSDVVGRSTGRRRALASTVVLALVPLATAWLWARHADAIKAASPPTAWLTSGELVDWNFGSLAQRSNSGVREQIYQRVFDLVIGPGGVAMLAVAVVAAVRSAQAMFWLSIGLAAVLPPLVFTNLYWQHDYYFIAISPALAALIGLGAGFLWQLLPRHPVVLVSASLVGLALAYGTVDGDREYWHVIKIDDPDTAIPAYAREVAGNTLPADRVGLVGLDWSPAVLYYARRWGHMVVSGNEDLSYDDIHEDGYRYLFVANPTEADLTPLSRWPWLGALGPHSYAIADDPSELGTSQFISTDDPSALVLAGKALSTSIRVRCGPPARLRSGLAGTMLRISNPSRGGRVSVSDELAPLPTRQTMFVGPRLANPGSLILTCSGQRSLAIDVFDAPLPSDS